MSEIGEIPQDLKYSKEHEWVRTQGAELEVGITAFAANALGDVVFVELPAIGSTLSEGKPFGVVESVKSVSDLFAPVNGRVTAINATLNSSPELVNESPYAGGWMIRLQPDKPDDTNRLLNAVDYQAMLEASAH
ncbi:MAG: glycine cleavage system protein GcvH [Magnetococcales bacterium]|nr:glycine cleavage system protein GcvH [Magnetococcales bacterium]MBF0437971.1 glycine cleavage system protein GcvH [Magnetococcales bacterium]